LDRGRDFFGRRAWGEAFAELSAADREAALELDDLERLAEEAYPVGADAESDDAWARAHHECLRLGVCGESGPVRGLARPRASVSGEMARGGGGLALRAAERGRASAPGLCCPVPGWTRR
jgi:hypothetical protein